MWQSTFKKLKSTETGISPVVRGIGGCWGLESLDPHSSSNRIQDTLFDNQQNGDSVEPFYIQYEQRMECMRRVMIQEQKHRLRMFALSTLQYTPIKQNKFLDRKKNIFTDAHAQNYICTCQKTKKISKMVEQDELSKKKQLWKHS